MTWLASPKNGNGLETNPLPTPTPTPRKAGSFVPSVTDEDIQQDDASAHPTPRPGSASRDA
jgi:hypothetical protein